MYIISGQLHFHALCKLLSLDYSLFNFVRTVQNIRIAPHGQFKCAWCIHYITLLCNTQYTLSTKYIATLVKYMAARQLGG